MTEGAMYTILTEALKTCEKMWGTRPHAVLACAGYADEHWQIYNSDELAKASQEYGYIVPPCVMPRYILTLDGVLSAHPNSAGK